MFTIRLRSANFNLVVKINHYVVVYYDVTLLLLAVVAVTGKLNYSVAFRDVSSSFCVPYLVFRQLLM